MRFIPPKPPKSLEQYTTESIDLINSQLQWFHEKIENLEKTIEKLEQAEKNRIYKTIQFGV